MPHLRPLPPPLHFLQPPLCFNVLAALFSVTVALQLLLPLMLPLLLLLLAGRRAASVLIVDTQDVTHFVHTSTEVL